MKVLDIDEKFTVGLDPVDTEKVEEIALMVRRIIDVEDELTIQDDLYEINDALSNDERIELASILKQSSPGGTTRKTYVSIYNEWLRMNRHAQP